MAKAITRAPALQSWAQLPSCSFQVLHPFIWDMWFINAQLINFLGVVVSVFGTIPQKTNSSVTPIWSFFLDEGTKQSYIPVLTGTIQRKQLFFRTPELIENTEHTLTIVNENNGSSLSLDYIAVFRRAASLSTTTSAVQPFSSSGADKNTPVGTYSNCHSLRSL